jgi:hypothetical protein
VAARHNGSQAEFAVAVEDDIGAAPRVVVLYRELPAMTWQKAELIYNPLLQVATGAVPTTAEVMEYFVQAVDSNGNVAVALDHGNAWLLAGGPTVTPTPTTTPTATPTVVPPAGHDSYLPVVHKSN